MIKNLYILGLGLLLGITATATISFSTTPPKMPTYPTELSEPAMTAFPSGAPEADMQNRLMNEQKRYDSEMKAYNKISSEYNFNINTIRVGVAVAFLVIAGVLFKRIPLLPEVFAAGAVMVLLGISSSTLVSFYSFDTSMTADSTFKVSQKQLGLLYTATIIAGAVGYFTLKDKKKT